MAAAAAITLLLLLVGGVVASAGDCDPSANFPVRGVANQLAAAAAAAACSTTTHLSGGPCDLPRFVTELVKFCKPWMDAPGAVCCAAVLLSVDADSNCLCRVIDSFEFMMSDLMVSRLWDWYEVCGGKRRSAPDDKDSCNSASASPPSPPPPSPPPPPAKPEAPSGWPIKLWVVVAILCGAALAGVVFVALKIFLPRDVEVPLPTEEEDITAIPLRRLPQPQMTTGREDGSLRAGEEAAINSSSTGEEEEEKEEEESPPACVEERSTVARPRLPPAPPFHPLMPSLIPPLAGPPPPSQITAY